MNEASEERYMNDIRDPLLVIALIVVLMACVAVASQAFRSGYVLPGIVPGLVALLAFGLILKFSNRAYEKAE